jgi:putative ABC transport system permease protein
MTTLINDIKYAFRQLRKSPGFTTIVVLTLALGIGANTVIFSVVNAVLLRTLPFPDSDRLVILQTVRQVDPTSVQNQSTVIIRSISYLDFADWRQQSRSFEDIAIYDDHSGDLISGSEPERVWGSIVSPGYFSLLGAKPVIGRTFLAGDDKPGAEPVIVLSYSLWNQLFGGDVNIQEQNVRLDDRSYRVVGVLPKDYPYAVFTDAQFSRYWIPQKIIKRRNRSHGRVIGRLKAGYTLARAEKELSMIAQRIHNEDARRSVIAVKVEKLSDYIIGDSRPYLLVLLGVIAFVLLIACANVANLVLARATSRHKEIAVRRALGAGMFRIMRQLLTENLVLSLLGGITSMLVALWSMDLVRTHFTGVIPRADEIGIDLRVLGFTLVLSIVTGLILGMVLAFRFRCVTPQASLVERGTKSTSRNRLGDALVVLEIAAVFVLLIGAGLMLRTFHKLLTVDPGFHSDRLLTFRILLPSSRYNKTQREAFCQRALEKLAGLPGVENQAIDTTMPFGFASISGTITILGRTEPKHRYLDNVGFHMVTLQYFPTMGIPLRVGRLFDERDFNQESRSVIINEELARRCWPHTNPIDEFIMLGDSDTDNTDSAYKIVGIVSDTFHDRLTEQWRPCLYFTQAALRSINRNPYLGFAVRTKADPENLIASVRSAIGQLDPLLPVDRLGMMRHHMAETYRRERFSLLFLGLFAGLAVILVGVGIYGVVSYLVGQRTQEIGVRMALGAQQHAILAMILRRGLILSIVGSTVGVIGALALSRFLSGYLYDISTTDPVTFILVSLFVVAMSLLACYIPARRAAKIDPMEALRYE